MLNPNLERRVDLDLAQARDRNGAPLSSDALTAIKRFLHEPSLVTWKPIRSLVLDPNATDRKSPTTFWKAVIAVAGYRSFESPPPIDTAIAAIAFATH